ncbi:uncharacterized protein LOC135167689 isoform X2 [Diachasmimorpha longicaudata]|uniref:uncharacterized protein LOC135167689 isoform X2 n=1 Tax=Diachasmimorpha longicaudata TaxID=58733 RepID=UPI0030B8FEA2
MGSQCCKCSDDKKNQQVTQSRSTSINIRLHGIPEVSTFRYKFRPYENIDLYKSKTSRRHCTDYPYPRITDVLKNNNSPADDVNRVSQKRKPMNNNGILWEPNQSDPPTFIRKLSDLAVKIGTRARLLIEVQSASCPKVTWRRNDEPIDSGSHITFVHEGNFYCIDLSPVTIEDKGYWTCTAENTTGRSSCGCFLNVLIPKAYKKPYFTEELRALLTEGGSVSLECKVLGVPTPVLKWFKDGEEMKAGDIFALTASPEDSTSLGIYRCEAINCMGTASSSSKVHVVGSEDDEKSSLSVKSSGALPIFKKYLENKSCKIGENVLLSCEIQVPPWPKDVTWYNENGRVEPLDKYHIIEDGLGVYSVEIRGIEALDKGEWKCVATSFENVKQLSACYISMMIPKNYRIPRFMEDLRAILTDEGLVSFECKVVGFPTPVLTWFKDGEELKPGDVYQLTGTNSLGSYCCIAKNCMGEAKSTAELTIEDIDKQLNDEERLQLVKEFTDVPKFKTGLKCCEARIDENFTFAVRLDVTLSPEPTIFWYRNNELITEDVKYKLIHNSLGNFHLEINNLEFIDQAQWKCLAENDFGHSVSSCFLKLIIPRHFRKPKYLENLKAVLCDDGTVNLECKVIGVPQPVLTWYKDGVELKPGDIHRIISGGDGTCCLGTYTCRATNCMGSVSSSASLVGISNGDKDLQKEENQLETSAKNVSLSTIHEERTSQLYDTPRSDNSVTLDDHGDISFSLDGKEISVSLYETPDLTEEDARQIVEMYADQLSEHITEGDVIELPPMRFTRETSTTRNLLMEAVVIDVSPDYFVPNERFEDLRTEADVENVSIMEDPSQSNRSSYSSAMGGGQAPSKPLRKRHKSVDSNSSKSDPSEKSHRKSMKTDLSDDYHSAKEPLSLEEQFLLANERISLDSETTGDFNEALEASNLESLIADITDNVIVPEPSSDVSEILYITPDLERINLALSTLEQAIQQLFLIKENHDSKLFLIADKLEIIYQHLHPLISSEIMKTDVNEFVVATLADSLENLAERSVSFCSSLLTNNLLNDFQKLPDDFETEISKLVVPLQIYENISPEKVVIEYHRQLIQHLSFIMNDISKTLEKLSSDNPQEEISHSVPDNENDIEVFVENDQEFSRTIEQVPLVLTRIHFELSSIVERASINRFSEINEVETFPNFVDSIEHLRQSIGDITIALTAPILHATNVSENSYNYVANEFEKLMVPLSDLQKNLSNREYELEEISVLVDMTTPLRNLKAVIQSLNKTQRSELRIIESLEALERCITQATAASANETVIDESDKTERISMKFDKPRPEAEELTESVQNVNHKAKIHSKTVLNLATAETLQLWGLTTLESLDDLATISSSLHTLADDQGHLVLCQRLDALLQRIDLVKSQLNHPPEQSVEKNVDRICEGFISTAEDLQELTEMIREICERESPKKLVMQNCKQFLHSASELCEQYKYLQPAVAVDIVETSPGDQNLSMSLVDRITGVIESLQNANDSVKMILNSPTLEAIKKDEKQIENDDNEELNSHSLRQKPSQVEENVFVLEDSPQVVDGYPLCSSILQVIDPTSPIEREISADLTPSIEDKVILEVTHNERSEKSCELLLPESAGKIEETSENMNISVGDVATKLLPIEASGDSQMLNNTMANYSSNFGVEEAKISSDVGGDKSEVSLKNRISHIVEDELDRQGKVDWASADFIEVIQNEVYAAISVNSNADQEPVLEELIRDITVKELQNIRSDENESASDNVHIPVSSISEQGLDNASLKPVQDVQDLEYVREEGERKEQTKGKDLHQSLLSDSIAEVIDESETLKNLDVLNNDGEQLMAVASISQEASENLQTVTDPTINDSANSSQDLADNKVVDHLKSWIGDNIVRIIDDELNRQGHVDRASADFIEVIQNEVYAAISVNSNVDREPVLEELIRDITVKELQNVRSDESKSVSDNVRMPVSSASEQGLENASLQPVQDVQDIECVCEEGVREELIKAEETHQSLLSDSIAEIIDESETIKNLDVMNDDRKKLTATASISPEALENPQIVTEPIINDSVIRTQELAHNKVVDHLKSWLDDNIERIIDDELNRQGYVDQVSANFIEVIQNEVYAAISVDSNVDREPVLEEMIRDITVRALQAIRSDENKSVSDNIHIPVSSTSEQGLDNPLLKPAQDVQDIECVSEEGVREEQTKAEEIHQSLLSDAIAEVIHESETIENLDMMNDDRKKSTATASISPKALENAQIVTEPIINDSVIQSQELADNNVVDHLKSWIGDNIAHIINDQLNRQGQVDRASVNFIEAIQNEVYATLSVNSNVDREPLLEELIRDVTVRALQAINSEKNESISDNIHIPVSSASEQGLENASLKAVLDLQDFEYVGEEGERKEQTKGKDLHQSLLSDSIAEVIDASETIENLDVINDDREQLMAVASISQEASENLQTVTDPIINDSANSTQDLADNKVVGHLKSWIGDNIARIIDDELNRQGHVDRASVNFIEVIQNEVYATLSVNSNVDREPLLEELIRDITVRALQAINSEKNEGISDNIHIPVSSASQQGSDNALLKPVQDVQDMEYVGEEGKRNEQTKGKDLHQSLLSDSIAEVIDASETIENLDLMNDDMKKSTAISSISPEALENLQIVTEPILNNSVNPTQELADNKVIEHFKSWLDDNIARIMDDELDRQGAREFQSVDAIQHIHEKVNIIISQSSNMNESILEELIRDVTVEYLQTIKLGRKEMPINDEARMPSIPVPKEKYSDDVLMEPLQTESVQSLDKEGPAEHFYDETEKTKDQSIHETFIIDQPTQDFEIINKLAENSSSNAELDQVISPPVVLEGDAGQDKCPDDSQLLLDSPITPITGISEKKENTDDNFNISSSPSSDKGEKDDNVPQPLETAQNIIYPDKEELQKTKIDKSLATGEEKKANELYESLSVNESEAIDNGVTIDHVTESTKEEVAAEKLADVAPLDELNAKKKLNDDVESCETGLITGVEDIIKDELDRQGALEYLSVDFIRLVEDKVQSTTSRNRSKDNQPLMEELVRDITVEELQSIKLLEPKTENKTVNNESLSLPEDATVNDITPSFKSKELEAERPLDVSGSESKGDKIIDGSEFNIKTLEDHEKDPDSEKISSIPKNNNLNEEIRKLISMELRNAVVSWTEEKRLINDIKDNIENSNLLISNDQISLEDIESSIQSEFENQLMSIFGEDNCLQQKRDYKSETTSDIIVEKRIKALVAAAFERILGESVNQEVLIETIKCKTKELMKNDAKFSEQAISDRNMEQLIAAELELRRGEIPEHNRNVELQQVSLMELSVDACNENLAIDLVECNVELEVCKILQDDQHEGPVGVINQVKILKKPSISDWEFPDHSLNELDPMESGIQVGDAAGPHDHEEHQSMRSIAGTTESGEAIEPLITSEQERASAETIEVESHIDPLKPSAVQPTFLQTSESSRQHLAEESTQEVEVAEIEKNKAEIRTSETSLNSGPGLTGDISNMKTIVLGQPTTGDLEHMWEIPRDTVSPEPLDHQTAVVNDNEDLEALSQHQNMRPTVVTTDSTIGEVIEPLIISEQERVSAETIEVEPHIDPLKPSTVQPMILQNPTSLSQHLAEENTEELEISELQKHKAELITSATSLNAEPGLTGGISNTKVIVLGQPTTGDIEHTWEIPKDTVSTEALDHHTAVVNDNDDLETLSQHQNMRPTTVTTDSAFGEGIEPLIISDQKRASAEAIEVEPHLDSLKSGTTQPMILQNSVPLSQHLSEENIQEFEISELQKHKAEIITSESPLDSEKKFTEDISNLKAVVLGQPITGDLEHVWEIPKDTVSPETLDHQTAVVTDNVDLQTSSHQNMRPTVVTTDSAVGEAIEPLIISEQKRASAEAIEVEPHIDPLKPSTVQPMILQNPTSLSQHLAEENTQELEISELQKHKAELITSLTSLNAEPGLTESISNIKTTILAQPSASNIEYLWEIPNDRVTSEALDHHTAVVNDDDVLQAPSHHQHQIFHCPQVCDEILSNESTQNITESDPITSNVAVKDIDSLITASQHQVNVQICPPELMKDEVPKPTDSNLSEINDPNHKGKVADEEDGKLQIADSGACAGISEKWVRDVILGEFNEGKIGPIITMAHINAFVEDIYTNLHGQSEEFPPQNVLEDAQKLVLQRLDELVTREISSVTTSKSQETLECVRDDSVNPHVDDEKIKKPTDEETRSKTIPSEEVVENSQNHQTKKVDKIEEKRQKKQKECKQQSNSEQEKSPNNTSMESMTNESSKKPVEDSSKCSKLNEQLTIRDTTLDTETKTADSKNKMEDVMEKHDKASKDSSKSSNQHLMKNKKRDSTREKNRIQTDVNDNQPARDEQISTTSYDNESDVKGRHRETVQKDYPSSSAEQQILDRNKNMKIIGQNESKETKEIPDKNAGVIGKPIRNQIHDSRAPDSLEHSHKIRPGATPPDAFDIKSYHESPGWQSDFTENSLTINSEASESSAKTTQLDELKESDTSSLLPSISIDSDFTTTGRSHHFNLSEKTLDRYQRSDASREYFPGPRHKGKKPTFCMKLIDRTAAAESRIKLTCTVLGDPDPFILWMQNSRELFQPSNRYCITNDNGVVSLEIYSVKLQDSGEYTCIAKNVHGEAHTEAKLKVYAGYESTQLMPIFTRSMKDIFTPGDDRLVLECRVRAQPPPVITWLKDGKVIDMGNRYRQSDLPEGICRLEISNPDDYDNGMYTCRAENKSGFTECNYPFTCHENAVTLNSCGTSIETRRKRHNLTTDMHSTMDYDMYSSIPFDSFDFERSLHTHRGDKTFGNVECGNVKFDGGYVYLKENGKPAIFISRPVDKLINACVGEDVSLSFRVGGVPKPKVILMKGLVDITNGSRSYKESHDDYVRITFKRIEDLDEGTYCILVKNRYGYDRSFFTIRVRQRARSLTPARSTEWSFENTNKYLNYSHEPKLSDMKFVPGPISSEPVVIDGGNSWLALSWDKPEQRGQAPIVAYRVDAWLLGGDGGAQWTELGVTSTNSFDAFNLCSGEEYKFRITPRNRYGWGESVTMTNSVTVRKMTEFPEFSKILPGQLKALKGTTLQLDCEINNHKSSPYIRWYKDCAELDVTQNSRFIVQNVDSKCSLSILDVRESDSGRYVCDATNVAGRVSTFAKVQVVTDPKIAGADLELRTMRAIGSITDNRPPEFTMRLRDRRVQATYPVRLTCQVDGNPEPTITWFKDEEKIDIEVENMSISKDDGHFHTLEISRSKIDNTGIYMVRAENAYGCLSCRCHLVVDEGIKAYLEPKFSRSLDSIYTVIQNDELRMTAQIKAYPAVGITWYRNGRRLRPNRNTVMSLHCDGTVELTLAHISHKDAGTYCCIATNEVGRADSKTVVNVTANDDDVDNSHRLSMETGQSSSIPYSKEPVFITKPLSTEAYEGDNIIILCQVIGDPKPDVFWLRDFLRPGYYKDAPHFRPMGLGPQYQLEIPYAKLDFTGTYSVIAKNCFGEAKAVISLQIYARDPESGQEINREHTVKLSEIQTLPVIESPLRNIRCCDGDAVTFICKVDATPPPHIRWEKGNKLVALQDDISFNFENGTAQLHIQHVYPEDEGEYVCVAYNDLGSASTSACLIVDVPEGKEISIHQRLKKPIHLLSPNATPVSTPRSTPIRSLSPLCVIRSPTQRTERRPRIPSAPKFYAIPHNRVAEEGETVRFQCAVTGHPIPRASWDKDGMTLVSSTKVSVREKDDLRILEIMQITCEDAGLYRITLENELGRVEATARLEVIRGKQGSSSRGITQTSPILMHLTKEFPQNDGALNPEVREEFHPDEGEKQSPRVISSARVPATIKVHLIVILLGYNGCPGEMIQLLHKDEEMMLNNHMKIQRIILEEAAESRLKCRNTRAKDSESVIRSGDIASVSGESRVYSCDFLVFIFISKTENITDRMENSSVKIDGTDEEDLNEISESPIVEIMPRYLFDAYFETLEEIGKGRYGVVRKVIDKTTKKHRAAKFIRTIKSKDRQQVLKEIDIMNAMDHPKLLRLITAFEGSKEMVMVMEYITGGELFERVAADDFTLTERDGVLFVKQICEAVAYMHDKHIVHMDLKPENIMCQSRTCHRIKLIDFGLAQTLTPNTPIRVLFGTPEFVSPEIISFEPIGPESDMWSIGVICYVLLTGLSPFMGDSDAETFVNITGADYDFDDEAFSAISEEAIDFISSLLIKKKELRMSAKSCLTHPWLTQCAEKMSQVVLSTDKLKNFIIRRKWQKTGNAIRALGRMANLSAKSRRNISSDEVSGKIDNLTSNENPDSPELMSYYPKNHYSPEIIIDEKSLTLNDSSLEENFNSNATDERTSFPQEKWKEETKQEIFGDRGAIAVDSEETNAVLQDEKSKPLLFNNLSDIHETLLRNIDELSPNEREMPLLSPPCFTICDDTILLNKDSSQSQCETNSLQLDKEVEIPRIMTATTVGSLPHVRTGNVSRTAKLFETEDVSLVLQHSSSRVNLPSIGARPPNDRIRKAFEFWNK